MFLSLRMQKICTSHFTQYSVCNKSTAWLLYLEIIMGLKASLLFETSPIIFFQRYQKIRQHLNYSIPNKDSTLDSIMIQDKDVAVLVG